MRVPSRNAKEPVWRVRKKRILLSLHTPATTGFTLAVQHTGWLETSDGTRKTAYRFDFSWTVAAAAAAAATTAAAESTKGTCSRGVVAMNVRDWKTVASLIYAALEYMPRRHHLPPLWWLLIFCRSNKPNDLFDPLGCKWGNSKGSPFSLTQRESRILSKSPFQQKCIYAGITMLKPSFTTVCSR